MDIGEMTAVDLKTAYEGSYYFIAGCSDPLDEWVTGYNGLLAKVGIGEPKAWFKTTGATINRFAGPDIHPRDLFADDLTCLLFPLDDGLDIGKLAIFKLRMDDRWFDDVIDNMRRN